MTWNQSNGGKRIRSEKTKNRPENEFPDGGFSLGLIEIYLVVLFDSQPTKEASSISCWRPKAALGFFSLSISDDESRETTNFEFLGKLAVLSLHLGALLLAPGKIDLKQNVLL